MQQTSAANFSVNIYNKARLSKFIGGALAIASLSFVGACSTPAPPYAVSIPNVQALKLANAAPISVASFSALPGANNESIGVRANTMVSGSGTFAKYIENALIQELTDARLLDPKADVKIGAVIIKNDISAGGFITNSAEIEARFTVTQANAVKFEKVKRAQISWDSSFLGAVAIPNAIQKYPVIVTELLKELYADKEFIAAIKKQ